MSCDVLMVTSLLLPFTFEKGTSTMTPEAYEMLEIAHGLSKLGHSVVIANAVRATRWDPAKHVTFVPFGDAVSHIPDKALFIDRTSVLSNDFWSSYSARRTAGRKCIVVRAMDEWSDAYKVHQGLMETYDVCVACTEMNVDKFRKFCPWVANIPSWIDELYTNQLLMDWLELFCLDGDPYKSAPESSHDRYTVEERAAWDRYLAASVSRGATAHSCAVWADSMLEQRRKRFGRP